MLVTPTGLPKERRFLGGVRQSFEIQMKDRPKREVIATARTAKDLEGVQSGIEAWLTAYSVLNSIADPKSRTRIFPNGDSDSYFSRAFIDRIGEVEEGWTEHHVKVSGLKRVLRRG